MTEKHFAFGDVSDMPAVQHTKVQHDAPMPADDLSDMISSALAEADGFVTDDVHTPVQVRQQRQELTRTIPGLLEKFDLLLNADGSSSPEQMLVDMAMRKGIVDPSNFASWLFNVVRTARSQGFGRNVEAVAHYARQSELATNI